MKNLLMILGVVEIEDDVRALGAEHLDYNRTPDYKVILENIFKGLQYVHQTENPVLLVSSSGTGVMEGAATNILNSKSEALYVNGGVFGERWGLILKQHGIKSQEIKLNYGETVKPQDIKKALDNNPKIEAVFLTHNETSTGTKTDIKSIAEIIKELSEVAFTDCALRYVNSNINRFRQLVKIINKAEAIAKANGLTSIDEIMLKEIVINETENFETNQAS